MASVPERGATCVCQPRRLPDDLRFRGVPVPSRDAPRRHDGRVRATKRIAGQGPSRLPDESADDSYEQPGTVDGLAAELEQRSGTVCADIVRGPERRFADAMEESQGGSRSLSIAAIASPDGTHVRR